MRLVLLILAALCGSMLLFNPFPAKVNEYIVAVFATLHIYNNLRAIVKDES
jgi:hypothetical protein